MRSARRIVTALTGCLVAVGLTAVLANAFGPDAGSPARFDPKTIGAADIVLFNGKISTVDARNSVVQAIAIRDGEVLATGRDERVRRLAGRGTTVVNLRGRRVLPG